MSKKMPKSKTVKKQPPKAKKKKNANSLTFSDIKRAAPATFGHSMVLGAPRVNGGKAVTVKHCEYLDDIIGSSTFVVDENQVYQLNPGLTDSFPWLGTIAAGFEQYRWKSLKFYYKSRIATNANGVVYMATQLDSKDPDFTSKQELMAYAGAGNTNVWLDFTHNCLLLRGDYMKKYFVRTGPLADGQDPQLYDTGKFTWADVGGAGQLSGELYVDYEVELYNPKMNLPAVGMNLQLKNVMPASSADLFTGSVSDGNWMPNSKYITTDSSGGVTFQQSGLYKLDLVISDADVKDVVINVGPDCAIYDDSYVTLFESGYLLTTLYTLVTSASTGLQLVASAVEGAIVFLDIVQAPLAALASMAGPFITPSAESVVRMRKKYPRLNFQVRAPLSKKRVERKEGKTRKTPSLAADLIQPPGLAIQQQYRSVSVARKPLGGVPVQPLASCSQEEEEPY